MKETGLEEVNENLGQLRNKIASVESYLEKYVVEEQEKRKQERQNSEMIWQTMREEHHRNHSITQELIDEGAFDVAKSYIDFLKQKASKPENVMVKGLSVSSVGNKTMKKNSGADFGPDTKDTKTSGIQEALDKAMQQSEKIKKATYPTGSDEPAKQ